MTIFTKLHTLLRAGARESAERITDANAIRIYRQEIVDAENLLERRRLCLAGQVACRKDLEQEIATARQRIQNREAQIAGIDPKERTESLLLLAAKDIAATQGHLSNLEGRRLALSERIGDEERTLRKLLTEIKEHRREIKLLAVEVASAGRSPAGNYCNTVAAHLATLRKTRESITGTVSHADVAEASFTEAMERVDGDPLERELSTQGRDAGSVQLAVVLERLRGLEVPAEVRP
jgi:phage shock protein A